MTACGESETVTKVADTGSVLRTRAAPVERTQSLGRVRFARAPRREETSVLFERWQAHGELAARDGLVRRFLPLAHKLARRYLRSSEPYEDLAQVASFALVKAVERYDASRQTSFSSYAIPTISGELKRYFRDAGWSVHVPRGSQERALAIERANTRLTDIHGRTPSVQQLAEHLDLSCEQVLDGLQTARAYEAVSLDAPRAGAEDDELATIGATLGGEDARYGLIEDSVVAAGAIRYLTDRERSILALRFVGEKTQSEIATELGISQMQVSRLLRRALDRLRALANDETPSPAPHERRRSCA